MKGQRSSIMVRAHKLVALRTDPSGHPTQDLDFPDSFRKDLHCVIP
jgi:hypothetical protein